MKRTAAAVVMLSIIGLWGCTGMDKREAGRAAEYRAKVQEYMEERYPGEGFEIGAVGTQVWTNPTTEARVTAANYPGRIIHVRADRRGEPAADSFLLIKLEEPLSELMGEYVRAVYGEAKVYISYGLGNATLPAGVIHGNATAEEYMEAVGRIGVDIYTTAPVSEKETDVEKLRQRFEEKRYEVSIQIFYLPEEEYEMVEESSDIGLFITGTHKYYEHGRIVMSAKRNYEFESTRWESELIPNSVNLKKEG